MASRLAAASLPPAPPEEVRGSGRAKPSRGRQKRNAKEVGRAGRNVTFAAGAPATASTKVVDGNTGNSSIPSSSEGTRSITVDSGESSKFAYTLAPAAQPTPSTIVTQAAEAAAKAAISGHLPEPKHSKDSVSSSSSGGGVESHRNSSGSGGSGGKSLFDEISDAKNQAASQSGASTAPVTAAAPAKSSRFKQKAAEKSAGLADGNKRAGQALAPSPVKLSVFERNSTAPLPMRCSVLPGVQPPPVPLKSVPSVEAKAVAGGTADSATSESSTPAGITADLNPSPPVSAPTTAAVSASSPDWRPGMANAAASTAAAATSTAGTANAAPPSAGPFLGSIEGYVPRSLDRAERAHPFLRNPFAPPEDLAETESPSAATVTSPAHDSIAPAPVLSTGDAAAAAQVNSTSTGGAPALNSTSNDVVVGDVAFRVMTGSEAAGVVARADAKARSGGKALPIASAQANGAPATALGASLPHSAAANPAAFAPKKMETAAAGAVAHPPQKHVQGYDAHSTDPIGAAAGGFGSGDTDDDDDEEGGGNARAFEEVVSSDDSDEDSDEEGGSSSLWTTQTPYMAVLSAFADWRTAQSDAFVAAAAAARSAAAPAASSTVSSVPETVAATSTTSEPNTLLQHPEVLARREALHSAFQKETPWLRTATKTTPSSTGSLSGKVPAEDAHLHKTCPICCDAIATTPESSRTASMVCQNGHAVHAACVKCLADSTCPECRSPLLATPQANDTSAVITTTAATATRLENSAIEMALANTNKLLDCLVPMRPLPTPATSVLAPRLPSDSDVTTAFWRLVFLVLVTVAWPHEAQPLPSALFDPIGQVVLECSLAEEIGVDSAEFGALCRGLIDS